MEYHNPNPLYPHGDAYDWRSDCKAVAENCCCPCYVAGEIAKDAFYEWTGHPSHTSQGHQKGKKGHHGESVADAVVDIAASSAAYDAF